MNKNNDKIEDMISAALNKMPDTTPQSEDIDECLDDETIEKLYDGTLPTEKHLSTLEHLDKCELCRDTLAFHAEKVSMQTTAQTLSKLSQMKKIIPELSKKMSLFEIRSLCRKISYICRQISDGSFETIDSAAEQILIKLQTRFPQFAVQVRGEDTEKTKQEQVSMDKLIQQSKKLCEQIDRQLDILSLTQTGSAKDWIGEPEIWIFSRLTEPMKQRATHIRDWCESKLETLAFSEQMRDLPLLGISHSKRVLGYGVKLLQSLENYFCDPLTYYAVYAGVYCYDIGMLISSQNKKLIEIYNDHGKLTYDLIMGNPKSNIASAWPAVGFSSQQEAKLIADICCGRQKNREGNFEKLQKTASIFIDSKTMPISLRAISAILKLANMLDLNINRLVQNNFTRDDSIDQKLVDEYLKHEITEQVNISETGSIHITLKKRYVYPEDIEIKLVKIKSELEKSFIEIHSELAQCAIPLPMPKFTLSESVFLDPHPYLTDIY